MVGLRFGSRGNMLSYDHTHSASARVIAKFALASRPTGSRAARDLSNFFPKGYPAAYESDGEPLKPRMRQVDWAIIFSSLVGMTRTLTRPLFEEIRGAFFAFPF